VAKLLCENEVKGKIPIDIGRKVKNTF